LLCFEFQNKIKHLDMIKNFVWIIVKRIFAVCYIFKHNKMLQDEKNLCIHKRKTNLCFALKFKTKMKRSEMVDSTFFRKKRHFWLKKLRYRTFFFDIEHFSLIIKLPNQKTLISKRKKTKKNKKECKTLIEGKAKPLRI
jgi:hypothetical protein